ncbi:MAG: ABC transporter substrate-binding protein [Deltaproteobacteria bacterium]|nr:ABC transporter substrate-binding protein [Deltaproteobacteria bacterium]
MNKKRIVRYVVLLLAGCIAVTVFVFSQQDHVGPSSDAPLSAPSAARPKTRIITDMAGRQVSIPEKIQSVFSRSPMGTLLMYTLNPSKIAGLNWAPTTVERQYLCDAYLKLPVLGGWYAGKEGNIEEIMKTAPDVMIHTAENASLNRAAIDLANRIESMVGIPVIVIDAGIRKLPAIYRFAGSVLEESERANALAAYVEDMLAEIDKTAATISEDQKIRVYYAEGPEGLNTDPTGSLHSELLEMVGAKNVATTEVLKVTKGRGGMGRAQVSPEQLLVWNPDMILVCQDLGFGNERKTYDSILKDSRFFSLKAVKNGLLFQIPYTPFNVFDRPPSVNRIVGVKWLAHLIYPNLYPFDIRQEFKKAYKLFYRISLSDEQLDDILRHAERKPANIP